MCLEDVLTCHAGHLVSAVSTEPVGSLHLKWKHLESLDLCLAIYRFVKANLILCLDINVR